MPNINFALSFNKKHIHMTVKKTPGTKEDILQVITAQLLDGLAILKDQLGDKKFEKRVKKAAKLLVEGIKKPTSENPDVTEEKAISKKEKAAKTKTTIKVAKGKAVSKIPKAKKAEPVIKVKTKKQ